MTDQEKGKIIEEHLPDVDSIMEEYQKQGKALTREEAESIRETIRSDMEAGHIDAREDFVGDELLEKVAGGVGGSPLPTKFSPEHEFTPGFLGAPIDMVSTVRQTSEQTKPLHYARRE